VRYVARKPTEVTAWKYEEGVGVPVWVARKCHDLGNGKLTANSMFGPVPIDIGNYVVLADDESGAVVVVPAADFEAEYVPAPSDRATVSPQGKANTDPSHGVRSSSGGKHS
jgi:hypothetical protein